MEVEHKRCPECVHVERKDGKFCSECGFELKSETSRRKWIQSHPNFALGLIFLFAVVAVAGSGLGGYQFAINQKLSKEIRNLSDDLTEIKSNTGELDGKLDDLQSDLNQIENNI